MPEEASTSYWYQKIRNPISYKEAGRDIPIGSGSFRDPLNVLAMERDETKPGLRKVKISELNRLSNSNIYGKSHTFLMNIICTKLEK